MRRRGSKLARLEALEAQAEARRREAADRVPLADLLSMTWAVLGVVGDEAGAAAADRVAVRVAPLLEAAFWRAGVTP